MAKFKTLNIGDTVRLTALADTDARCGYTEALEQYVGGTFEVTELDRQYSTNLGQVKLSCGWWFSPKGLVVLNDACATRTGDEHGEFVTPKTPVGTTVVYIGGDDQSKAPVGVLLELKRHDRDTRPLVCVIGGEPLDFYFPDYKYLRVHKACSTPEPVVHATEDFKYTRVRDKDTGAEGVIVGRSRVGDHIVAVLHDVAEPLYHDGGRHVEGFIGVPNRIWYYQPKDLEIIGGVQ